MRTMNCAFRRLHLPIQFSHIRADPSPHIWAWLPVLLTLAVVWLLLGSPLANAQAAADPQIVAFGDLRGELLPCGCSPEGQLGGLPRRETYWNQILARLPVGATPPVLIDLGNNFPEPSDQGRLKIDVIQSFLGRMPVAAILPGPNELQIGYAVLDRRLPYTVTNNDIPGAFATYQSVVQNGQRLLIVGYLSPSLVFQGSQDRFRLVPLDGELIQRYEALARQQRAQRTVLLFRGTDQELVRLLETGMFNVIVAGNPSGDELTAVTERHLGRDVVPQVPTKGQGAVVITLGTPNITRIDKLTQNIPDGAETLAALKVYDGRVKALFFEQMSAREALAKSSPFVGAQACKDCHAPEFTIWQGTAHAHALHALEKVGKQFDPECVECHVVGLNRGGFVSTDATPHLAGVQCENCHGAGRAHAADPAKTRMVAVGTGAAEPNEVSCRTCHRGSHSPSFTFAQYWPRIQHQAAMKSR
jgi:hypothetical protein